MAGSEILVTTESFHNYLGRYTQSFRTIVFPHIFTRVQIQVYIVPSLYMVGHVDIDGLAAVEFQKKPITRSQAQVNFREWNPGSGMYGHGKD